MPNREFSYQVLDLLNLYQIVQFHVNLSIHARDIINLSIHAYLTFFSSMLHFI